MSNIKQIRWSELRDVGVLGYVGVQMVGELSPEGWNFSEKEAFESVWYPIEPTKELVAKAIAELNKQRPVQGDVQCFLEPGALARMQNVMLDEREKRTPIV